jgi:Holliday junction resolvasome RuvABC ATP-dependent DNA helicase subunit
MTVIVVAPLLLWYDKSRFLQDSFELVKHLPAAAAGPDDSAFLRQILERRGALELMDRTEVAAIAKYSGGVLRDLLTLARSAAEYAYRDDEDRIARRHVQAAVRQLGNRYLVGLGKIHIRLLRRLAENDEFRIWDSTAKELLVNRQVLEYFSRGREHFAVHPALAKVLPKPA